MPPPHSSARESSPAGRPHAPHDELFRERFGEGAPTRRFFAPGRVSLMGAHLDYNGGPVMPMALDRGTFVSIRPRNDDRLVLSSTLEEESLETRLTALPKASAGKWYDYPLGVILRLLEREERTRGADVLFHGNLPIGAGLSSSASICVGTAYAFLTIWGGAPEPMSCIDAALWGEREWVGVRCGIMDPYAVALSKPGHVLWVDCKEERVEHIPYDAEELLVAVVDTGIRRELAKGAFNQRVSECQQAFEVLRPLAREASVLCDIPLETIEESASLLAPEPWKRARHVVAEVARTHAARAALVAGDLREFGRCIMATHASLRDYYEVSVPELDCIVETAQEIPGVLGGRLTGAGFGGCAVVLLTPEGRAGLGEHIEREYERRFGYRPSVFFFRGDAGPREV